MQIGSISAGFSVLGQAALDAKNKILDLQTQIATGKKSTTYSGMGLGEGFAVAARSQIGNIGAFADTITNVNTSINVANTALQSLSNGLRTVQSAITTAPRDIASTGQTTVQQIAQAQLSSMLGVLNTQAGDRYVFSGAATDTASVASFDDILNGNGALAGVSQMITERTQADLGAGGMGRITVSAPGAGITLTSLTEDGSVFGLKLNSITSTLTGATVVQPGGGPPPTASVDLGPTNPNDGDKVTFKFNLPDGTTEDITLTATTTNPPPAGSFLIDTTSDLTATNLNAALNTAITTLANTSLTAASAVTATNSFFSGAPQRVNGPPATAMTLVAATPADTVTWYTGDAGGGPARATAIARVDTSVTVQYGVRANEQAIRTQLQGAAVLAAFHTIAGGANSSAQITALFNRVQQQLTVQPGQQTVDNIQSELANAQTVMKDASSRQTQAKATLQSLTDNVENITSEEVISQILALQTSVQASYQSASILSQLSLVKFLPIG